MRPPRLVAAFPGREGAHHHAEIEACDMDQVAFVDVLASAQPRPAHAAAIEDMGEAALDQFAASI